MLRVLFLLIFPILVFSMEISNIYRIGTASVIVNDDRVDGTLLGYKLHVRDDIPTYAADINYIFVDNNIYGIEDTGEVMAHLGAMVTDALELYGSYGYAFEDSADGFGWGWGLVYAIGERVDITYEYRDFDMEDNGFKYTLESASLGILIRF